uniref:Uncharacterized protein n=1 Tax=Arundo donax TaxID=35708 RepID=A0A0A8YZ30_ARUDO
MLHPFCDSFYSVPRKSLKDQSLNQVS